MPLLPLWMEMLTAVTLSRQPALPDDLAGEVARALGVISWQTKHMFHLRNGNPRLAAAGVLNHLKFLLVQAQKGYLQLTLTSRSSLPSAVRLVLAEAAGGERAVPRGGSLRQGCAWPPTTDAHSQKHSVVIFSLFSLLCPLCTLKELPD